MDYPHWMLIANCAATLRDEDPATQANASTYDRLVLSIGEDVINKLNFIAKIPDYRNDIHEIAKKTINKTYADDTFTSIILGDLHLARKNLQDAYENKATIGGKQIIMSPQFISKRIDEVSRAISDILTKVDDIKSIRDCCSNIKAQLPGKEDGFSFDLKISSESRAVRVEIYEEESIFERVTYHNSRVTYILKDYPSLRGDLRFLRPDIIDDMKKEGASLIDVTEKRITEEPLFSNCRPVKLKDILEHEQTAFRWQPDGMDNEDVK